MVRFVLSAIAGILLGTVFGLGATLTLVAKTMDQPLDMWELLSIIAASHFAGCATALFVFSLCYFWKPIWQWVAEGLTAIAIITRYVLASANRLPKE